MILIPSIDLLGGKVVRVKQGREESAIIYSEDPLGTAEEFLTFGAKWIHIVDLDAALHNNLGRNNEVLRSILNKFRNSLKMQIGGGIRNEARVKDLLREGAERIVVGSLVYEDLDSAKKILESCGTERLVLALDYDENGYVRSNGWKRQEKDQIDLAISKFKQIGFTNFLITSIAKDGMMQGPDIRTLGTLRKRFSNGEANLIASGGIYTEADLRVLKELLYDEVVVGKGLYEKKIPMSTFSTYSS
ncbi:MAG TPA: 1-(5-phosphoribosyl)-5-[(5-phosphoribosylamino)methylideneamino] imidazole-4-carboxamide isomerase [Nitrososphaerales archaeon]|nr:1-(5-phosphoribosyl)-5-[(5-phosphoribosylamino)methylideneamino] imidazole-4-carboxamide isomerase [Nitrososphaerales archaeon]